MVTNDALTSKNAATQYLGTLSKLTNLCYMLVSTCENSLTSRTEEKFGIVMKSLECYAFHLLLIKANKFLGFFAISSCVK